MLSATENEMIRKLLERASRGELDGIDVMYRVTGGAPGEQLVDEEIQLSGPGPVKARMRSPAAPIRESSQDLGAPEMKELLLQIGEGAGELIPQSQARFIPDSIVGQISVKIDGQETSFFLLGNPDEYTDMACPGRTPVNTGTVMDNNSNNVPQRLMQRLADNVGSNVM